MTLKWSDQGEQEGRWGRVEVDAFPPVNFLVSNLFSLKLLHFVEFVNFVIFYPKVSVFIVSVRPNLRGEEGGRRPPTQTEDFTSGRPEDPYRPPKGSVLGLHPPDWFPTSGEPGRVGSEGGRRRGRAETTEPDVTPSTTTTGEVYTSTGDPDYDRRG